MADPSTALPTPPDDRTALKCQCADLWGHPAAQLLLGDSLRPGGPELTARLLDIASLSEGAIVVDIGSGPGSTLRLLTERGLTAIGVDYSPTLARDAATAVGAATCVGDGERLGLRDGVAGAVTMECVLSALPDKRAALDEVRRVLAPGGWLLLSDMTLADAFPEPLDSALAWAACAAGALTPQGYAELLTDAGFTIEQTLDAGEALGAMVAKARRRLALFQGASGVGLLPSLEDLVGPDLATLGRELLGHDDLVTGGRAVLAQVADAVRANDMGYTAIVARATGAHQAGNRVRV